MKYRKLKGWKYQLIAKESVFIPELERVSARHPYIKLENGGLIQLGLLDRKYRDVADQLFRRICLEKGMKKHWADLIYNGLKALGEGATKPDKHPKGEIIEI